MKTEKQIPTYESLLEAYNAVKDLPDLQLRVQILENRINDLHSDPIEIVDGKSFSLLKKDLGERLKDVEDEIKLLKSVERKLDSENIDALNFVLRKEYISVEEYVEKLEICIHNSITTFYARNINNLTLELQICIKIKKELITVLEKSRDFEEPLDQKLTEALDEIKETNTIYEDECNYYLTGIPRKDEISTCKNLKGVKLCDYFFSERNPINYIIASTMKTAMRKKFVENKVKIDEVRQFQNKWFKNTEFYVNNLDEWAVTSLVRKFIECYKQRHTFFRKSINIKNSQIKQISSDVYNLIEIFGRISKFETTRTEKIKETKIKTIKSLFTSIPDINSEKFVTYLSDLDYIFSKNEIDELERKHLVKSIIEKFTNNLENIGIFTNTESTVVDLIQVEYNTLTKLGNEINQKSSPNVEFLECLIKLVLCVSGNNSLDFYRIILDFIHKLFELFHETNEYKKVIELRRIISVPLEEIDLSTHELKYLNVTELREMLRKINY